MLRLIIWKKSPYASFNVSVLIFLFSLIVLIMSYNPARSQELVSDFKAAPFISQEKAIENARAYYGTLNLASSLDLESQGLVREVHCRSHHYPRSCYDRSQPYFSTQELSFWVVALPLEEQPLTLNLGDITQWQVGVDAQTGDMINETHSSFKFFVRYLLDQMWNDLQNKKYDLIYNSGFLLYESMGERGKILNASLTDYPWKSQDDIHANWPLNGMGEALFIMGEALMQQNELIKSKALFQMIIDDYHYSLVSS